MIEWSSASPEETRSYGVLIGSMAPAGTLILLQGNLGAGKTCITQGIAEGLSVPRGEWVTSPTYTILNIHEGRLPLYHFDLYRLGDGDELYDLGFTEYIDGDGVAVIEWPERAEWLFNDALIISLERTGDDQRKISIELRGEKNLHLWGRLQEGAAHR